MKKIFLLILTLSITAAAFAIEFSSQVYGAFNLLDYYDSEFGMGGGERGRIRFEGSTQRNNFGGWVRLNANSLQSYPVGIYGYVFYKPFDKLSFYITRNPDGHFSLDGNALWNFYGSPADVIGVTTDLSYAGSFVFDFDTSRRIMYAYPGFNNTFYSGFTSGTFITYTPTKELTVNLGFDVFDNLSALDMFKYMTLQVTYKADKIGLFGLTYTGRHNIQIDEEKPPPRPEDGGNTYEPSDPWSKSPVLRAYYGTTLSGIKFDFGLGFMLPVDYNGDTRSYPINIGAAATFDVGKVNLKARVLISGFGSYKYNGITYKTPFDFIFDFLPSMPLTSRVMGYCNLSLFYSSPETGDSIVGWSLYPYVTVGNTDSFTFFTGMEIIYQEEVYWRVPFGIRLKI